MRRQALCLAGGDGAQRSAPCRPADSPGHRRLRNEHCRPDGAYPESLAAMPALHATKSSRAASPSG
eukprot:scaffold558727_cov43-Prasinocladus_malaysianus.AAC.1